MLPPDKVMVCMRCMQGVLNSAVTRGFRGVVDVGGMHKVLYKEKGIPKSLV